MIDDYNKPGSSGPTAEPDESRVVAENWQRYRYGIDRGHRDYNARAARLEGFYLGGEIDRDGKVTGGGQWTEDDLDVLDEQGRPAYEFNGVLPAVNAAIGYQIANRMDIAFKPRGGDATKELAEVRSKVAMQIADNNNLHWRETEVFADGLVQQRGYFEARMCWDDSTLGEFALGVLDPMDVIPDPDSKSYDPKDWSDVIITRFLTLDEIEGLYGPQARKKAEQSSGSYLDDQDFGEGDDDGTRRSKFATKLSTIFDAEYTGGDVRRLRVIDRQKRVRALARVALYPSGDIRPIEDAENPEVIAHLKKQGAFITKRMISKVKWIVTTCSAVLHNDWSPYDRFTVIPYFPYFRRGKTRGMVDNAIGPQTAANKGLSQYIHIINTTANSGWVVEENSLTNMTTEDLEDNGSSTGLVIEHAQGTTPPQKIQPNRVPEGVDRLINVALGLLKDVTVPDAMRGNQGPEQSGIAIQSTQHAAQQQLSVPLDNLARTRNLLARWIDYAIGRYYDSERVFLITKTDASTGEEYEEPLAINQFDPETGSYLNDMTAGEYHVVVTEQPMSVTFENSQFQQALEMRNAGVQIPDASVVKNSNLSDKHEIIQQLRNASAPPDPLAEAKARLLAAQARKTDAEAVNKGVEGMFSATQAAQNIAVQPAVAPLADTLLRSAGFQDADAAPIVPEVPQDLAALPPQANTNPLTPANPAPGMNAGIEGGAS